MRVFYVRILKFRGGGAGRAWSVCSLEIHVLVPVADV